MTAASAPSNNGSPHDPQPSDAGNRRLGRVWLVGLLCAAAAAFILPQATNAADTGTGAVDSDAPSGSDYVPSTTIGERSLDISALSPQCIAETPYIAYAITPTGFTTSGPITLSFYDINGNFIESRQVPTLTGSTIYPGASVNPPDWPGWKQAPNGNWIPDDSNAIWRDGLTVKVSLEASGTDETTTLEASGTVSYPPASSSCAGPGEPSLNVGAFTPVCISDAPFIQYDVTPVGFTPTGPLTLTFYDKNGNFIESRTVTSLSGQTIYPGASVDANGKATDWPGWTQAENGNWIPDDSDAILRDGLQITVSADSGADQPQGLVFVQETLSATATVSYPEVTSPCFGPPEGTPPTTTICVGTSTSTGGNSATTTVDPCYPCVPGTTTGGSSSSSATGGENGCDPCVPGSTTGSSASATTVAGTNCSLPRTGSDGVQKILALGAIALAAGAVITLLARRRKGAASV